MLSCNTPWPCWAGSGKKDIDRNHLVNPWSKFRKNEAHRECFVDILIWAIFLWILSTVFLFHQFVIYYSDNMCCHISAFTHCKQKGFHRVSFLQNWGWVICALIFISFLRFPWKQKRSTMNFCRVSKRCQNRVLKCYSTLSNIDTVLVQMSFCWGE